MISAIVCTRNQTLRKQFEYNLAHTIGVTYELIFIDNSEGKYGLCQAYNRGAYQSQYPYLCFVHEDVLFRSQGWGDTLISLLNDPVIGAVGVAGGTYKAATISGWWDVPEPCLKKHLIQHNPDGSTQKVNLQPTDGCSTEVTTLDGVFLSTRREVWQQHPFDENVFSGFHFYDTDFCTQIGQAYQVVVTSEITLEHLSSGKPASIGWIENAIKYHQKWKNYLPLAVTASSYATRFYGEKLAALKITQRTRQSGFPLHQLLGASLRHVRFPYWLILVMLLPVKVLKDKLKTHNDAR